MMAAQAGDARLANAARGSVAAVSSTLIALASHLAAGGQMPGLLGVVAPLVLSLLVCVAWSGRRLSLVSLSGSVLASQVVFHLLFAIGAPSGTPMLHGAGAGIHAGHQGAIVPTTVAAVGQTGHPGTHTDATMWLWHALAGTVTVLVLHRGELLLRDLLAQTRRAAAHLFRSPGAVGAGIVPAPSSRLCVPCANLAFHLGPGLSPLRRRGAPTVRLA